MKSICSRSQTVPRILLWLGLCVFGNSVPGSHSLSQLGRFKSMVRGLFRLEQRSPSPCTEKLVCLLGSSGEDEFIENRELFKGISNLASASSGVFGNPEKVRLGKRLFRSWQTGRSGKTCQYVAPKCQLQDEELLEAHRSLFPVPGVESFEGSSNSNFQERRILSREKRQEKFRYRGLAYHIDDFHKHPLRTPRNSMERPVCRKCEAKRSTCFTYYLGTYGICGAASLVAGFVGSTACNLATIPRVMDCTMNSYQNCFNQDCGLVNMNFDEMFQRRRRSRKYV